MDVFSATHRPINLDYRGWHIWHGAAHQKVFANGPDESNRHLEFADHDEAVTWFFMTGRRELARALNDHVRELVG